MPLIVIFRALFSLFSLLIPVAAGYLLWTWFEGEPELLPNGAIVRIREEWRLWVALALIAWCALGRVVITPLLARGDTDPSRAERSNGIMTPGAEGASLYVEMSGPQAATPIILTHGWGLDSTAWYYAKRDLGRQFRVIAWDLPSLGRSKSGSGARSIGLSAFAANLKSVIDLAGDQKVILVGHSIGGMTIQTLARDLPELFERKVAGVVLLNTTYTNPLKTMIASRLALALRAPLIEPLLRLAIWLQPLAWLSAWQSYFSGSAHVAERLGFGGAVTRSQLEHATLLGTRNPPGALARGNLAMFKWDASDVFAGLNIPILVVGGEKDIVTKLEASHRIAASASGANLQAMQGANHMGFMENAAAYDAAIAEFAERVSLATGSNKSSAAAPARQTP
jgi:pimeloyl-ACP methyl ester carboxylesterase